MSARNTAPAVQNWTPAHQSVTAPSARATCRMTTAKGHRCTGEPLDTDPKTIQICMRHAAEVLALINERKTR